MRKEVYIRPTSSPGLFPQKIGGAPISGGKCPGDEVDIWLERKEKNIAKRNSSDIYSFINFNGPHVVQVLSTSPCMPKIHSIPLFFTGSLTGRQWG